jgi:hypothetical protein
VDAEPAPEVVRRTIQIGIDVRAPLPDDAPLAMELDQALLQLRADRANGESVGPAFARLCEAIAAARAMH